jgi:hypothetical protein
MKANTVSLNSLNYALAIKNVAFLSSMISKIASSISPISQSIKNLENCFSFKDRKNTNNNANTSGDELDEELGDFQLPLALSPRASSSLSHHVAPTHVILQQQRSSSASVTIPSSLQHDVVLHSNVTEPLLPTVNRFDLNLPLDRDSRNQLNRKANSLMTVYEHSSTNDIITGESSSLKSETWRTRSPSSICDLTYQRTTNVAISEQNTDEQETVNI